MTPIDRKRAQTTDLLLASIIVAVGLVMTSLSLAQLASDDVRLLASDDTQTAQATPQPLQSTPGAESKPFAPDEPSQTGARPREISPQPARPDPDAIDAGAKAALPPAPAEKIAPPINAK